MDTSNSTPSVIDYITNRPVVPNSMTREDYADLFDEVNKLIARYLSDLGMKPIDQTRLSRIIARSDMEMPYEFKGVRATLAYTTGETNTGFNWEVYLTEQGHWVIAKTWLGREGLTIIRNRDDFVQYFNRLNSTNGIHPAYWLIAGPQFILGRVITIKSARLATLSKVDDTLSGWNCRIAMIEETPPQNLR